MSTPQPGRPPQQPRVRGIYAGAPFGVPIYFSWAWLIPAVVTTVYLAQIFVAPHAKPDTEAYLLAFGVSLLLAASVLLHELSHSLIARRLGLRVRQITITLTGGATELESEPPSARGEYLVAVAGPLTSLVLAALGFTIYELLNVPDVANVNDIGAAAIYAEILFFANGLVAVVNLLPGLPLDGGRVLRSAVWRITGDPVTGTIAAANGGRLVAAAALIAPLALSYRQNPASDQFGWALIGAFVAAGLWVTASMHLQQARLRRRLTGIDLRRLARRALPIPGDITVAEAVRRAHRVHARSLVIVNSQGRAEAIVSEPKVIATPERQRPWTGVRGLAQPLPDSAALRVGASPDAIIAAVNAAPGGDLLVVEPDGRVIGVLTGADLARGVREPGAPGPGSGGPYNGRRQYGPYRPRPGAGRSGSHPSGGGSGSHRGGPGPYGPDGDRDGDVQHNQWGSHR